MATWSHSRINTFETCPRQYRYRYVDQIPVEKEGIEAFMGSRVHEALEWLYKEKQTTRVASEGELLTRYFRGWEAAWHPRVTIVRDNMKVDDYRDKGAEGLIRYYRRHRPFEDGEVIGLEHKVNFRLKGPSGSDVRGVIDRLVKTGDGTIEIHDYKTSGRKPEPGHFEKDWQLALYQLALHRNGTEATGFRLVWHYLIFDQRYTSTREPEALEELEREVEARIARIEAAPGFPARVGPLCRWCSYNEICPEYIESRVGGRR